MTIKTKRKLEYADRVALQQADQAIRKDIVRALVELITNSNDSYQRQEDDGDNAQGEIIVELQRKHRNATIRLRDFAEGMNSDQLDKNVGTYGGETSGFAKGRSVRGLWGRGLKDAVFGLGHGDVFSIRDSSFEHCSLSIKDGKPMFSLDAPIRATRAIRKQHQIETGNGTIVSVTVSRADVKIPQFDNLRRHLERHFELRTIMENPKRKVLLRELDGRGKPKKEMELRYAPPMGTLVLNESFELPNVEGPVSLEVFRSDVPLSTPLEEGDFADGGFLIISKHVVLSLTLFKFEANEFAARFFGRVTCDHLYDLLRLDPPEPILTATRDGVNWTHKATKAIKLAVEARLQPIVEAERLRIQAEQRGAMSKKLRERLDVALKELNSIASLELGKVGDGTDEDGGTKRPFMPPGGFGFVPTYVYVQTGKPASITLRAQIPDKADSGSIASVESDNQELEVLTPTVTIRERSDYPGIGEAHILIEGRQVGSEAILTAQIDEHKTEALIKVISKKTPPVDPATPKHRGMLIHGFLFDPTAEPRHRVKFDRSTSKIVVSTKAPSVEAYLDEKGEGHESPQGQVLLAELISEAVCREIARRGVESGQYLTIPGAEADAIQREAINLQNKYAHVIHACIVEAQYRRNSDSTKQRGRPRRAEALASAAIEA